jgi:prolyl oligopeptidase
MDFTNNTEILTKKVLNYPDTPEKEFTEIFYGEEVIDPYRWLEDLKEPEVADWFRKQAEFTDEYLKNLPGRESILEELKEIDSLKRVNYDSINKRKGVYFFKKRNKGEDVARLCMRKNVDAEDTLLFDPESAFPGKDYVVHHWSVNESGTKLLIVLTEKGRENGVLRILDVETGRLDDEEWNVIFASWIPGSDIEFTYMKQPLQDVHDPDSRKDLMFMLHIMGEDTASDRVLLSAEKYPSLNIRRDEYPAVMFFRNSGIILAGKFSTHKHAEIFYADTNEIHKDLIDWKPLFGLEDEILSIEGAETFLANGNHIYALTSRDSPRRKLIRVKIDEAGPGKAEVLYAPVNGVIEGIQVAGEFLMINEQLDSMKTNLLKMRFDDGSITELPLPFDGTANLSMPEPQASNCILDITGWDRPLEKFNVDLHDGSLSQCSFFEKAELPGAGNIVSKTVEVVSHDGEIVPLSIIYDKTVFRNDGSNICLLNGYGAYGVTITPHFNKYFLPMFRRGVILAWAHIRGGGEKGEEWHKAGMKITKPNSWKDLIACAEWLTENQYTSPERLGVAGGSAGGIAVGMAVVERPDLFKFAIPAVGLLSMIRFGHSPNGPANAPEFGSVDTREEYAALKAMDAYQNLKPFTDYPATLIITGYNDPRVISWVPAKFAARLQKYNTSANPVLLKVDYSTGHGGGETVSDIINNLADEYAFLLTHTSFEECK